MSFARNFALGQQIAERAINTAEVSKQKKELAAIQSAKPEFQQGYTQGDGKLLESIANAKDAEGNAAYQLDARPDGSYGIKVRGTDGNYNAVDGAQINQRPVGMFMGQTYDQSELTPDKVQGLRNRAMVGVLAKTDPIKAMGLMQSIEGLDQARTTFNNQQTDREEARALLKNRRSEYERLSKLEGDALAEEIGGAFSRDGSGVSAMLTFDPKQNKYLFTSKEPGVPSATLSRAELLNYAMGLWEQGNGDFNKGLEMALSSVRAQRDMDNQAFDRSARMAQGNADLFWKGRNYSLEDWYKRQSVENDRARIGIAREGLAVQRGAMSRPQYVGNDASGQPVYIDMASAPRDRDGRIRLPGGISALKPSVEMTDREKLAFAAAHKTLGDIAASGQPVSQAQIASVARAHGLDPAMFGAQGMADPFGQPPTRAAMPGPGAAAPTNTAPGQKSGRQLVQEAYDAWQNAKGPWYLPTPTANSKVNDLEAEYLRLLRQYPQ